MRSEHEALESRAREQERRKEVGIKRQEETVSESKRRRAEAAESSYDRSSVVSK